MNKKIIKIGNASGFWGDDQDALRRMVEGGRLDYITMDFLAEVTMSIMKKQMDSDPNLGYARDFIPMLEKVLAKALSDGTKIITNAGGVNPKACAMAIYDMAKKKGLNPKIAVVYGDDILDKIEDMKNSGIDFKNMETGESFETYKDRMTAANVYFGAAPVVEALKLNPDIIITGRVTDTGITLAPMVHEFSWSLKDWNKLAAGIVGGHIIECGSQSTGGNFTDWEKVESFKDIGFPILEVSEDGSFVVTKHEGSGGLVSLDTVREQLFYEMGDPKAYITPDVVADFSSIRLVELDKNRVKVFGVKGHQPTEFYKVSMAYQDGFKSSGSIIVSGPNARKKAELFSKIFWEKCPASLSETATDYVGLNSCHKGLSSLSDSNEIMIRLSAKAPEEKDLIAFAKTIPSLILSGPPGVAVLGGNQKPQRIMSYWPCLIPKKSATPIISILSAGEFSEPKLVEDTAVGFFTGAEEKDVTFAGAASKSLKETLKECEENGILLSGIAMARSGDKGDSVNIGVIARHHMAYEYLDEHLTAQLVKDLFQDHCLGKVVRYKLPNMMGFNFILEKALGGGGTSSLRIDPQGKTFAQAILMMKV